MRGVVCVALLAAGCGAPAPTSGARTPDGAAASPPTLEMRRVPDDPEPPAVAIPAATLPPMLQVTLESGLRVSVATLHGELAALRCTLDVGSAGELVPGATNEALQRLVAGIDLDARIEVSKNETIVRATLLARDLERTITALGDAFARPKKPDAFTRAHFVAPRLHLAIVSREDPQRVAEWVTEAFRGMPATSTATATTTAPATANTTAPVAFVLVPGPATRVTIDLVRELRFDGDAAAIATLLVASPDAGTTASLRRHTRAATPELVGIVRDWIARDAPRSSTDLTSEKRAARAALEAALAEPVRLADWLAVARRASPAWLLGDLFGAIDAVDATRVAAAARAIVAAPTTFTIEGTVTEAQRAELATLGTVVDAVPVR